MAAPKGNRYYTLVKQPPGRKPVFKDPDTMLEQAYKYFEWCLDNPLRKQVTYHSQGLITQVMEELPRVFTLNGLCLYLGIDQETFRNYSKKQEFFGVTKAISEIIYQNKFEGASNGLFQTNIIARDLGLADKRENENNDTVVIKVAKTYENKGDEEKFRNE